MTDAELDMLLEQLGERSPECRILVGIIRHLRDVLADLQTGNAALGAENAQLRAQVAALQEELQEERRRNGRPAAPHRIPDEKRAANPKRPGRPPGHQGAFRAKPDHIDEEIDVVLNACPQCNGVLKHVRPIEQFIEEIPPLQRKVIHLVTYEGVCQDCGVVRSSHPLQVSIAVGAAGTHLGPNATALAANLLHHHGIPKRRVARILEDITGLRITAGGLVHLSHRLAGKLAPRYDDLLQEAKDAPVIHADETSWWVGRPGWTLWVFTNKDFTLYRVCDSRARAVVHATLGTDFGGVLVTDCLSVYDEATRLQHKCYAHHFKAVAEMAKQAPGTIELCDRIQSLLQRAMLVKKLKPVVSGECFAIWRQQLVVDAEKLFRRPREDRDEERLAKRFRKQLDHLFTFLDYDEVDATNNLAERQLRPAVISRKLSCGNRTPLGAATWEVLASLAATCAQRAQSFIRLVAETVSMQVSAAPP
jgi:transposase